MKQSLREKKKKKKYIYIYIYIYIYTYILSSNITEKTFQFIQKFYWIAESDFEVGFARVAAH